MITDEFLSHLRSLHVELWSDGERLRCNAPQSVLTPELWAELKSRKQEVLVYLREAGATVKSRAPALRPFPRSGNLPLSFAQQRLWFFDQLEENSPVYNIIKAVQIVGPLNIDALRKTVQAIVARHEVLRTTFAKSNGAPIQRISDIRPVDLKFIDLSPVAAHALETEFQRLLNEEARRPFNLSSDLMLRATLLKFGPEGHVLQLVMHHIASDGWSMGVLFREVFALYEAFSNDRPSPLDDLPIQYADFAVWQKEWLQGEPLDAQLRYWKKQLAGIPELLELPTDRPRPAVQTYHGAWETVSFPETVSDEIRAFSRREGATLFMTLLAAFKILLHRYTEQGDIVVGSPTAGRNRVEIEGLIGCFVNMLVLRTDFSGDLTFREVLGRVRETALGAYAHQDLPFEKLVEELQPKRALDHNPLFQVAFDLESGTNRTLNLAGLTTFSIPIQEGIAKFDLTLFVTDTGKDLSATLEYNTDLFDQTTIRRMLGHLQTLLRAILANPDEKISGLEILAEEEKRQLAQWNHTKREYSKNKYIHELIEEQAERTPDVAALVFEGKQLTYRELNQKANQLAHYLRVLGVAPDVLVGICVERSEEMIVGLLGILKAGGAYVPLDPSYPAERLAFMIKDAHLPVLLTQARLVGRFPESSARVICLDRDCGSLPAQSVENPSRVVSPENLAYVIYTSGSTGQPKGAMNTHKGICNRLLWMQEAYHLTGADHVLQKTPFSFDVSVWEVFWPLLTGARLILARPGGHQDSAYLVKLIVDQKVTTLHFVPSMLRVFLEEPGVEKCRSLKRVVCSGEALPSALQERFFARLGAELHNLYGPTEAAVDVTFWACERKNDRSTIPIGRPIANTQIHILDSHLRPVPIGVPGELCIGGVGVARGYLNRPELTAEKFIHDAFSNQPAARLYRTGDLARYLSDGNIEYRGRIDYQVKIRGFRIELGEIESALLQHPGVRESVVMVREDVLENKRLVGYVVTGNPPPTTGDLRSFLQQKLPDYMVPGVYVFLEALPLTANGKIDRRALPAPRHGRENVPEIVLPRNDVERQLVQIWEDELGVRPISIHDDFFDLGGHSLLAVRVFARIEQSLGVRLPLSELFHVPTVEGLAGVISGGARSSSWRALVPIQVGGSCPPLFAVPGIGGNVLCYADLAWLLPLEQPFYGLQSRGLDGLEKPLNRIEEIAASFLKEIREVQAVGPYYLMGACVGGVVAYEMAQQLRAAGQEVRLLVLLETWLPDTTAKRWRRPNVRALALLGLVFSRLRLYFHTLKGLHGRQRFDYALERLKMVAEMIIRRDVLRGDPSEYHLRIVTEANLIALQHYRPRDYPGRVALFRAEDRNLVSDRNPTLGWSHLLSGSLETHTVPGKDSGSLLIEPHVRSLARQLEACIRRAQLVVAFVAPSIEAIRFCA